MATLEGARMSSLRDKQLAKEKVGEKAREEALEAKKIEDGKAIKEKVKGREKLKKNEDE